MQLDQFKRREFVTLGSAAGIFVSLAARGAWAAAQAAWSVRFACAASRRQAADCRDAAIRSRWERCRHCRLVHAGSPAECEPAHTRLLLVLHNLIPSAIGDRKAGRRGPVAGASVGSAPAARALRRLAPHQEELADGFTWHGYLVQLLHIASSIEHALMVQYLYAAYSLYENPELTPHEQKKVAQWRNLVL